MSPIKVTLDILPARINVGSARILIGDGVDVVLFEFVTELSVELSVVEGLY